MEFSLSRQEVIVPSPPSPAHVVTLSNNDQIMPPVYTSFLYFYPPPSAQAPQTLPLKNSLARALAAFPPVAGRLKLRHSSGGGSSSSSNGAAGMDVDCNNQGAVFVEAHTSTTLQHLLTTGVGDVRGSGMYQPSPLWKLLAPNPYAESTDNPLLFAQLTRLGCGGVVVAVLLHHLVGDGAAQTHFVASWAELARGEAIAAHPHLDRACMRARMPPCPAFEHPEYIVHTQLPPPFSSAADTEQPSPPMTSRIFEFRPQDMQVLKERANVAEVGRGGDVVTGFQALAAHIWKHTAKARGTEPWQESKLGWAVDGRKRFTDRPLPPHYFGNVNFYGCTHSNVGELIARPLHHTALLVQSATQRITDEYMHSALDLIEVQETPSLVNASFIGPAHLAMTSWVRFSAYEVDFGWGKPIFFALPMYDFTGLAILLPHPHGQGGVNAFVGMFQHHMDALLSDVDFYPVQ